MKIFVLSKRHFDHLMIKEGLTNDNVEKNIKAFFISINDSCGTDEVPHFTDKHNVKVLFFDDVDKDEVIQRKNKETLIAKAFSEEQGRDLIKFIDRHRNKKVCIIHCAAGISRSGAVGEFINDYVGNKYEDFKKDNPHTLPNGHVLRTLNNIIREKAI